MTRIDWWTAFSASGASALQHGLFRRLGGGWRRLGRSRRRHLDLGLAEGALQFVERHFAGAQRPLQHLRHQRALLGRGLRGGRFRRGLGGAAFGSPVQRVDQVAVFAVRLGAARFEADQDILDPVDAGEDQRYGVARYRHAVAKFAHQRFGGVCQRFQPWQADEAAGALDGVDQPKDVTKNLGIVRILLKADKLVVDDIETFVGLGQEFLQ